MLDGVWCVWRPEGCHAIVATASRPPVPQNWVQLEDGEGRDRLEGQAASETDLGLLRREASKLVGQVSLCHQMASCP